jgi:hypothetical protein
MIYWHVTMTLPDGKKVQSIDHRSKRDAMKLAEIEGAESFTLTTTEQPARLLAQGMTPRPTR